MTAEWPHDDVRRHVTSSINRTSIDEHGLDWTRMGATGGVAAGESAPDGYRYGPEMPAVFLCGTWDDVEFFWPSAGIR